MARRKSKPRGQYEKKTDQVPTRVKTQQLHSYSDDYALQILRQIVPAVSFLSPLLSLSPISSLNHILRPQMSPTSRIIIMDQVMPPAVNTLPEPLERIKRSQDLQMMLLCNAKERDEAEWSELFDKAGEGLIGGEGEEKKKRKLGILNVKTPPGSMMSLIEVGFIDVDRDGESEGGEKQAETLQGKL